MDDSPIYNVKAVSRLTGLSAVTLRAWERRYGLPAPSRGTQGYRLYSDHDIRTLRWLKNQIETGLSISRAAQRLRDIRESGHDPASFVVSPESDLQPISTTNLADRFLTALMAFDEHRAADVLRTVFTLYPVDRALEEVIRPVLVEIGERWHQGKLPVAVEHFATQFCLQHLMSMITMAGEPTRPGLIVAACAPGEHHEIGVLMIVLIMRRRGWDVKYLGANLPLEGLGEVLEPMRVKALLLSATRSEAALAVRRLPEVLASLSTPKPAIILGGQGFAAPTASGVRALGHWVDGSTMSIVQQIETIVAL